MFSFVGDKISVVYLHINKRLSKRNESNTRFQFFWSSTLDYYSHISISFITQHHNYLIIKMILLSQVNMNNVMLRFSELDLIINITQLILIDSCLDEHYILS